MESTIMGYIGFRVYSWSCNLVLPVARLIISETGYSKVTMIENGRLSESWLMLRSA